MYTQVNIHTPERKNIHKKLGISDRPVTDSLNVWVLIFAVYNQAQRTLDFLVVFRAI